MPRKPRFFMKKIIAFFLGLILFFLSAVGIHFFNSNGLKVESKEFGTWINAYKDMSYEAIRLNLNKDTMPVMGSSEFQHGRKTDFHPRKVFKHKDIDLMLLGSAYTQSLYHATLLASVEKDLKNRKAVLIISPSWFKKAGIKSNAFAAKFSETQYVAMLENPRISMDIKKHIAEETIKGLRKFPEMKSRVKRYNRLFLTKDAGIGDRMFYLGRKLFINEKDTVTVLTALKTTKIRKGLKANLSKKSPDWTKLINKAASISNRKSGNNKFFMDHKFYENKIVPRMGKKKDSSLNDSYAVSPEYADLETFFKVCKETDIEANVIILPINGYWYDYTGFPREEREIVVTKIGDLAKKYNANVTNLFDYSYEEYFFEDTVHPSEKGWVILNEAIEQIYKKD